VCVCDEAAGQGHLKVIRFLLSNGADTSLVDNVNQTACDVAIRFRQLAAIRLLSPNIGQNPAFFNVIVVVISAKEAGREARRVEG